MNQYTEINESRMEREINKLAVRRERKDEESVRGRRRKRMEEEDDGWKKVERT